MSFLPWDLHDADDDVAAAGRGQLGVAAWGSQQLAASQPQRLAAPQGSRFAALADRHIRPGFRQLAAAQADAAKLAVHPVPDAATAPKASGHAASQPRLAAMSLEKFVELHSMLGHGTGVVQRPRLAELAYYKMGDVKLVRACSCTGLHVSSPLRLHAALRCLRSSSPP